MEKLNYGYGIDELDPAPENPEIIQRGWIRKRREDGSERLPTKAGVKILHWNILADKLT